LPSKIWQTLGDALFWCNLFVISHILPITKATLVLMQNQHLAPSTQQAERS
jgi:hypothetical protein